MIPEEIIIHHSATKDSRTVSWGAIRDYHVNELGWSDCGYHFGIELARDDYEIFMGRMPDRAGAHCSGRNQASIGVCFVGDFDLAAPPAKQWDKGIQLVRWLMTTFNISIDHVRPHRFYNSGKTCPGKQFDMARFCAGVLIF